MIEAKKAEDERGSELLQISEAHFESLPRSVQMLLLTYSKPADSAQEGVMALELYPYRWPEIDSEMKRAATRIPTLPGPGRLKKSLRYANDYECAKDGAAWSRLGCTSKGKEPCPVCGRKVKPIAAERYVVVEWKPGWPSLWSRLAGWLPAR